MATSPARPSQKRKSDESTARKGPLPQVDLETLCNLVDKFQPLAAAAEGNNLESGRRWDSITEEYNQLKPNFNGYGFKDKKALRKKVKQKGTLKGAHKEAK